MTHEPQPTAPRPPQRVGVLKMPELLDFARRIGERLGFHVASDDFVGVRDTGVGLHIRRRRHLPIVLKLETQYRTALARWCGVYIDGDPVAYTQTVFTQTHTIGTQVTTITQENPGPYYSSVGSISCDTPVTTFEDTSEGSEPVSSDTVGNDPLDPADLLAVAIAHLTDVGGPAVAQDWTWKPGEDTPVGIEQELGYWNDNGSPADQCFVSSYQYRWRLTGPARLNLTWDQGGSSFNINLTPGDFSDWYDDDIPATPSPDVDLIDNVTVTEL